MRTFRLFAYGKEIAQVALLAFLGLTLATLVGCSSGREQNVATVGTEKRFDNEARFENEDANLARPADRFRLEGVEDGRRGPAKLDELKKSESREADRIDERRG